MPRIHSTHIPLMSRALLPALQETHTRELAVAMHSIQYAPHKLGLNEVLTLANTAVGLIYRLSERLVPPAKPSSLGLSEGGPRDQSPTHDVVPFSTNPWQEMRAAQAPAHTSPSVDGPPVSTKDW